MSLYCSTENRMVNVPCGTQYLGPMINDSYIEYSEPYSTAIL